MRFIDRHRKTKIRTTHRLIACVVLIFSPWQALAEGLSISIGTDLRGALDIVQETYQPLTQSDGGSGGGSSSQDDPVEKTLRPALQIGYAHTVWKSGEISAGFVGQFTYFQQNVRYPYGIEYFAEPLGFQLRSGDISVGPMIAWQPIEHWQFGAALQATRQWITLDTTFGSWRLQDNFIDNRIDTVLWVERDLFQAPRIANKNGATRIRAQANMRNGQLQYNLALRLVY